MAPLPDATVTIRDGSLGIVPPPNSSSQIKFGVSSIGYLNTIYSQADQATLTSQIGKAGPMAEAAAQLLAGSGGPVYCVPVNPSTYGTVSTVTLHGTGAETLTVVPKPAVQILAKCTTAGALGTSYYSFSVDGVTWSPPVVSAATVMVPNATITTLAFAAGSAVLGDTTTIKVDGTTSFSGSGANNITFSSASPVDAYNGVVTITTAGALGTMQFTYSLDGGITTIGPILSTGAGTYVIPDAGLFLTFTGTSTLGDYFTFTTTAASYTATDFSNAWAAVITDARTWGLAHVVGAASSVANSATFLTSFDTLLQTAATNYRYARGIIDVPTDTDANTLAAFAASASTRVMAGAGYAYTTGCLKPWVLPRCSSWFAAARVAKAPLKEDLGRVASGPLTQIPGSIPSAVGIAAGAKPLLRDEQVTPGLDAGRLVTLRSIIGLTGYYITNGNIMAPVGSDFKWIQYGRVMDVACANMRTAALQFLNDTVLTNSDGTIQERSARTIEQTCDAFVRNGFPTGSISDMQVIVSRTQNVVSTSTVPITLRILPVGYAKYIQLDIGFKNPNLGN